MESCCVIQRQKIRNMKKKKKKKANVIRIEMERDVVFMRCYFNCRNEWNLGHAKIKLIHFVEEKLHLLFILCLHVETERFQYMWKLKRRN